MEIEREGIGRGCKKVPDPVGVSKNFGRGDRKLSTSGKVQGDRGRPYG